MATRIIMKSQFCSVSFAPYITLMFLMMFHKNLVSSFGGEDFSFFLSVAIATKIMMKSKFRSVSFVPHNTLLLQMMFHKNLVSSFGGEDF